MVGRGPEPEDAGRLQKLDETKKKSFLRASRRNQLC